MGTEGGGEVRAWGSTGQPNREQKHHDTTRNMIATSSQVFSSISLTLLKVYPNGYIAVGYLLEQLKDHHHQDRAKSLPRASFSLDHVG